MNCPNCGRGLATGTRQCVYCGRGTGIRGSAPIVRTGEPPRRKGSLRWLFGAAILLGIGAVLALPQVRTEIKALLDRLLAGF